MPLRTPVMASLMPPEKLAHALASPLSDGMPSRSRMNSPMPASPSSTPCRMSLPTCPQSVDVSPLQMACTISGSFATSFGMPLISPAASFTTMVMPALSSSGSTSKMPSSSPSISVSALSANAPAFSLSRLARLCTSEEANAVIGPMLAVMALTTLFSSCMAAGSSFVSSPGSRSASAPATCVTAADTMGSASSINPATSSSAPLTMFSSPFRMPGSSSGSSPSCKATATCPMALVAVSISG